MKFVDDDDGKIRGGGGCMGDISESISGNSNSNSSCTPYQVDRQCITHAVKTVSPEQ